MMRTRTRLGRFGHDHARQLRNVTCLGLISKPASAFEKITELIEQLEARNAYISFTGRKYPQPME